MRDPFGNRGGEADSQYRSTIALPYPQHGANVRGRFSSNRDITDCEHNSRSMGERSSAILNIGSRRSALASLPSSVAGADHQQSKTDDVRQAVRDLTRPR